jgi:hypothetical protein
MEKRAAYKWSLTRALYSAGFTQETVLELFRFIDWIMTLPPHLAGKLEMAVRKLEEDKNMPYLTSIERKALQQGFAQGAAVGEAKGEAKGEARGKVKVAQNLLCEGLPLELVARTTGLPLEEVKALADTLGNPSPNKVSETPKPFGKPRSKKKP